MPSEPLPRQALLAHYAEHIVQTVQESLLVLDADLRVQVANAAFYRTFAAQPADTEGQGFFRLGNGQWDSPALRALLQQLVTTQTGFEHYEVRHAFPAIGLRVMRLNARRLEGTATSYILLTIVDITVLDRLIQEREALLRQVQAARTVAETAQHRSQDALAVRETFLAIAAHELKTPLTTMLGQLQLLYRRATRQAALTPADERAYQALFAQSQRLSAMIDQLFDVARIESGQLVLDRRPLSLAMTIQQVLSDLTAAAARHEVVLDLEADGIITADAPRMEQAISNLVTNAFKYSPAGSVVTILLHQTDRQICLDVRDQGIGIDRTELPLLFTPFYRSAAGAAQAKNGLGIGLYVVKEIVEQHGGALTVTSTPGAGSVFTICFPIGTP